MSELALQLIAENKRTKNPVLDLGKCGLTQIPEELFDCVWLEELNFMNRWWDAQQQKHIDCANNGGENYLTGVPLAIRKLNRLKILKLGGDFVRYSGITDLSVLKYLKRLQSLNVSFNRIWNIRFLQSLNDLQFLELGYNNIIDFNFLQTLTGLKSLSLSFSQISDISFLKSLTGLQTLDLSTNQISDINFLQSLTGLETLHLHGNQISDISFLQSLTGLKTLGLGYNQISDISYLQSLTSLKSLDLGNNPVSDGSFLQSLTGLQTLDLSFNQISDISFLQSLTSLKTLHLGEKTISDGSFLKALTKLQTLGLSGNQISDISFLQSLTKLQSLNLEYNQISDVNFPQSLTGLKDLSLAGNRISYISFPQSLTGLQDLGLSDNQISDISFLQSLTGLKNLYLSDNQISNIRFLQSLTGLQNLYLSENQISDIRFLQSLTGLQTLYLNHNQISDISFLQSLTGLQNLDLSYNQIGYLSPIWLASFMNISYLNLSGNPIRNIKQEIISEYNCLKSLKIYFNGLRHEEIAEHESKIILIGNGRVGKTCIINRWLYDRFNEEESTHGIIITGRNFKEEAERNHLENLRLNIWDFGGQDIYHTTHRYFMQTNALFLLVWDANTETQPEQEEKFSTGKKVKYKNYSIRHWLSYIKTQGKNSPVIIVQTKRDEYPGDELDFTSGEKKEFNIKAIIAVESANDNEDENGYDMLKKAIFRLMAEQLKKNNAPLPAQWFKIKEKIWTIQEENQGKSGSGKKRQMSIEDFTGFCEAEGIENVSVPVLLNYFHNTGLFYYKEGLFENNIVLDQQWAINAVYRIFNRKDFFNEDHPNGKFTGADLNDKWSIKDGEGQYSIDEQELFVSFMKQCEICFELTDEYKTNYFERTFLAPQLLPTNKPNSLAHQNLFKEGSIYLKYKHQFLHAAVIQRFIVRCGSLADETDMWQKGLLIKWEGNLAMIEAFPDTNEILVQTENDASEKLLEKIRNEIKEITKDESGIQEFASFDDTAYVSLEKLRTLPSGNRSIEAENGEWVEASMYLPLLHVDETNVFEKDNGSSREDQYITGVKNKPVIFFSYAWGEERERIVDELYDSLKNDEEYTLVRDKKDLGYRDLISDFMKKIGMGNFIIVVISDKYLRSEFCMFELYEILRNSKLETTELKKKIFPIYVENIALNKPSVQKEYIKHWQGAEDEWEDIKRISKNFSDKQNQLLIKIKKINAELGDLLMLLSDMNMLTKELLSANNFDEIKRAIKERGEL